MIDARGLTKRYPTALAVDDLTFTVQPGRVTGFLGPNGAGKSTTMRLILGLDRPTSGSVTVGGRPFAQHRYPLFEVGALLDAAAVHPGRRARDHLWCLAQSNRIPRRRVDEVVEIVGLDDVAGRRIGTYSLGMRQRLGIAAALLGDPEVLMFDEPVNGLDPEGIVWIRTLFRSLAAEGRTVFVSSHLMSEMSLTADHVIVIGRGGSSPTRRCETCWSRGAASVSVRSPDATRLAALIGEAGGHVESDPGRRLTVTDLGAETVGELAARHGVVLHELTPQRASLEETFFELTNDSVEYHGEVATAEEASRATAATRDATDSAAQGRRSSARARSRRAPSSDRCARRCGRSSRSWSRPSDIGMLLSLARVSRWDRLSLRERLSLDPTAISLRGVLLAQLAIGVLGVLVISAEYTTGMIRPTFTARAQRRTRARRQGARVRRRRLVVSTIARSWRSRSARVMLARSTRRVASDPGVLRAVLGAGTYLMLVGLLGSASAR